MLLAGLILSVNLPSLKVSDSTAMRRVTMNLEHQFLRRVPVWLRTSMLKVLLLDAKTSMRHLYTRIWLSYKPGVCGSRFSSHASVVIKVVYLRHSLGEYPQWKEFS